MDEVDDADLVVERVAALDLGKAGLEACAGVYYLLEAEGFDCWLINAREVKNVPGQDGPVDRTIGRVLWRVRAVSGWAG